MHARTCRILIVDDDVDNLTNLSDILSESGYEIDTAPSGEEAMELVRKNCTKGSSCQYNLCLLDFRMPGMDGVELYERILERNPDVRAIMITAYAGEDGVQRAVKAGTWKVLRKPVDVKQLLGMIDEVVALP